MGRQPGGRFVAQGVSLQDLIVFAYEVQPYQILDGPRWLDTERWDVTAAGAPGSPADVLVALQHLLASRFSLAIRQEKRELPIFALVTARADRQLGPQLKQSALDCAVAQKEALKTGVIPPTAKQVCRVEGRVGSIQIGGAPPPPIPAGLLTRPPPPLRAPPGAAGARGVALTPTPHTPQTAAGVRFPRPP